MATITIGDRSGQLSDMLEKAARAATGFTELGLKAGDVACLMLRNDFAFLEASAALGQIGAYSTPINWHSTASEARHFLEDSGAKALVIHCDLLAAIRSEIPQGVTVLTVPSSADLRAAYDLPDVAPAAGDMLWDEWLERFPPRTEPPLPSPGAMFYTSGTTGRPKGVRRDAPTPDLGPSIQSMFLTLTGMRGWLDHPQDATAIIGAPLYHGTPNGWIQALPSIGVNMVVELRFDAESLLRRIEQFRVTHALLVPTMFVRLLRLPREVREKYDLSSLKFIMHGGAPCPPHVKQAMIDWLGPIVTEHYGSTEVGVITFCDSGQWLAHPGTVGKPLDTVKVAIFDDEGNRLPTGQAGQIYCLNFGYTNFTYHGDPEKRRKAEREGLVSIGDMGYLDEDGFLYLSGRSAEIIVSGGVNIYPAEIEAELLKIEGIADCAVFGIPNDEFGEEVCAYLQPREGAVLDPAQIRATVKEGLASFKIPRKIEIVDALPREDSGKVFKKRLRDPYWQNKGWSA